MSATVFVYPPFVLSNNFEVPWMWMMGFTRNMKVRSVYTYHHLANPIQAVRRLYIILDHLRHEQNGLHYNELPCRSEAYSINPTSKSEKSSTVLSRSGSLHGGRCALKSSCLFRHYRQLSFVLCTYIATTRWCVDSDC